MRLASLLALALYALHTASAVNGAEVHAEENDPPKEPHWGRIYLWHGHAPIQYFRGDFGGPILDKEVEFYVPRYDEDRFGCQALPSVEVDYIKNAGISVMVVVDRGECTFEEKTRVAQDMGAAGVVIVSTDETVEAPAAEDTDEIKAVAVMVRHTAGVMMRAQAAFGQIKGKLLPMLCQNRPYSCSAMTAMGKEYMEHSLARSGHLKTAQGNAIGPFVSALYGGIVPAIEELSLANPIDALETCKGIEDKNVKGKVILLPATSACSILDRAYVAEMSEARVVLMEVDNSTMGLHPAAPETWQGYNVTLSVLAISEATASKLRQMLEAGESKVQLQVDNSIADTWRNVLELVDKSKWPVGTKKREAFVKSLIVANELDGHQMEALQQQFSTVAKGTKEGWNRIMSSIHSGDVDEAEIKSTGEATGKLERTISHKDEL